MLNAKLKTTLIYNFYRQKEVSDLLSSMCFDDFNIKREAPTTILDQIIVYIDKMAVLALPVDCIDEEKARFVSKVTREQRWDYQEKVRLSGTTSYDRVVQAFVATITD